MNWRSQNGICNFNCESEAELAEIDAIAGKLGVTARFSLRVNPDVDAVTHPYISTGLRDHKFGVDIGERRGALRSARGLHDICAAAGVSCHIGSQILDYSPILEAAGKVLALIERLQREGIAIDHVDLGGGLGIAYQAADRAPEIRDFIGALRDRIGGRGLTVMVEPGRSIVGPAGVLLTRVLYRKKSPSKEFVVVDAAMNDLIRPVALSGASRDSAAAADGRGCGDRGGRRGARLRDRRFPGARPGTGRRAAGRVSGDCFGRRLRFCAGLELQFPAARGGGAGGWRPVARHPRAREL